MTENYVQLNNNDILRLKIRTADGKETGEVLEFDFEDIELPLKYQELIEKDKKNREKLKNQIYMIDKKQDVKGKKLLSKNQEDKIRALNEFFKNEIEVYNIFLGENGVQKLLNGRKIGLTTLKEIDDIIEKQIAPYIKINISKINDKVKEKYGKSVQRSREVLKNE